MNLLQRTMTYEAGFAFDSAFRGLNSFEIGRSVVCEQLNVSAVSSVMSCTFCEPDLSTDRRQTSLCNASKTSPFIHLMSYGHMRKFWEHVNDHMHK